jgi:hypothetical protein
MTHSNYKLIISALQADFETTVASYLDQGYTLQGAPFIVPPTAGTAVDTHTYVQAVYKSTVMGNMQVMADRSIEQIEDEPESFLK